MPEGKRIPLKRLINMRVNWLRNTPEGREETRRFSRRINEIRMEVGEARNDLYKVNAGDRW